MKRNEVKQEYKWKLEDIFATDEAWEKEFKETGAEVKKIGAYKGKLSVAKQLLACLNASDALDLRIERLYCYARMRRDENGAVDKYVGMCDRMDRLVTSYAAASSYITAELSSLSDEYLDVVLTLPEFQPYSYMLGEVKRKKKYILPEREEKILAMSGSAMSMFDEIFGKIDYVDLPLPKIKDEHGKRVQLTHGKYSFFLQSPDRSVRKHAFDALYKTYCRLINTITSVYAGSVKADNFYAEARGYKSSLEKALYEDNVPFGVYDNLLSAVGDNLKYVHEYVALRKDALGYDKLHMYDMYVPIVENAESEYDFETAFDMVVKGLAPLGEEYRDYVGEIIIEGHTDTTGQYLNNLALSQQRALAVATYCLSDEMVGLSYTDKETFKSIMTANGRADADPVYNADGTVNLDASRRVVIKFRMKDSDMIDQMSAILEGSAQGD